MQLSRERVEGKASAKAQRQEYPWEIGMSLVRSRDRGAAWQEWSDKGGSGGDEIREGAGSQIMQGLAGLVWKLALTLHETEGLENT